MKIRERLKNIYSICYAILTILLTLFAIDYYINFKIKSAINQEPFIKKIYNKVNIPFLYIDDSGIIIVDSGADELIESIIINKIGENELYEIELCTYSFYNIPPIIESVSRPVQFKEAVRYTRKCFRYNEASTGYGYLSVKTSSESKDVFKDMFKISIITNN